MSDEIKWRPYGGEPADDCVREMAAKLVRDLRSDNHGGLIVSRTGDALVVGTIDGDGTIILTWCLVRHEADVR